MTSTLRAVAVSAGIGVLASGVPFGRRLLARFRRKADGEVSALAESLVEKARSYREQ